MDQLFRLNCFELRNTLEERVGNRQEGTRMSQHYRQQCKKLYLKSCETFRIKQEIIRVSLNSKHKLFRTEVSMFVLKIFYYVTIYQLLIRENSLEFYFPVRALECVSRIVIICLIYSICFDVNKNKNNNNYYYYYYYHNHNNNNNHLLYAGYLYLYFCDKLCP